MVQLTCLLDFGARCLMQVSRVTDGSKVQSETEDRLVLTVSDIVLPPPRSAVPRSETSPPKEKPTPIVLRVEFDRTGFLKKSPPAYVASTFDDSSTLPSRSNSFMIRRS
jgi:hypothetical protein